MKSTRCRTTTVSAAVNTAGFSETDGVVRPARRMRQSQLQALPYLQTCYPPAVNYTPLYYMINGVAFNKTNAAASLFPITPATIAPAAGTGTVLVRLVNAGLRMHVPSIVGSQVAGATGGTNPMVTGFKVIAEDGNPLPGIPKIKSEVFMAAGKTYDVMINGQTTSGTNDRAVPVRTAGLRPRVEPVGECDRARRRHAGLHRHQWQLHCR